MSLTDHLREVAILHLILRMRLCHEVRRRWREANGLHGVRWWIHEGHSHRGSVTDAMKGVSLWEMILCSLCHSVGWRRWEINALPNLMWHLGSKRAMICVPIVGK